MTDNHLALLRRMYVGWQDCETGAPEIDPKRPYGNSDVAEDVHEILTGAYCGDLTRASQERYIELHRETETALQIVLVTGSFVAGLYENPSDYDVRKWRLAVQQEDRHDKG